MVNLSPHTPAPELAYQFQLARPHVVITTTTMASEIEAAWAHPDVQPAPNPHTFVWVHLPEGFRTLGDGLDDGAVPHPPVVPGLDFSSSIPVPVSVSYTGAVEWGRAELGEGDASRLTPVGARAMIQTLRRTRGLECTEDSAAREELD